MKRIKKGDICLAAAVVLLAAALFAASFFVNQSSDGRFAEVRINGAVVAALPLGMDTDFDTNEGVLVRVERGKVFVAEADCPDRLCVRQGAIGRPGQMIVCLPNKVAVKIISDRDESKGVDAVA